MTKGYNITIQMKIIRSIFRLSEDRVLLLMAGFLFGKLEEPIRKDTHMWKGIGVAALAALVLLGSAGCGNVGQSAKATGTSQSEAASTKTLKDSTGTEVKIPLHPKRVVILNPSNVDLYIAAGGKSTLVGKPTTQSFSKETAEAVKDVQSVGMIHQPSAETITSLHPDLVIGVNVPYHVQLRDVLTASGVPLFINSLDSYEDVLHTLTFYGELTGDKKTADASIDKVKSAYDAAISRSQGKEGPESLIVFHTPQGSQMATAKSFAGDILRRLGGKNMADGKPGNDAYTALSQEYVAEKDPQKIFIISMGNSPEQLKEFRDSMATDDAWSGLSAVKSGQVYVLPGDLFTINPGMRIGDAMAFMADCLYGKE